MDLQIHAASFAGSAAVTLGRLFRHAFRITADTRSALSMSDRATTTVTIRPTPRAPRRSENARPKGGREEKVRNRRVEKTIESMINLDGATLLFRHRSDTTQSAHDQDGEQVSKASLRTLGGL